MYTTGKCLLVLMIVGALWLTGSTSGASQPDLLTLPESGGEPVTLRVRLPKSDKPIDWETCFAIYVDEADTPSSTSPVQGTYRFANDTLTFQPDFPFSPGVKYRVDVATDLTSVEDVQGVRVERLGRSFVGVPFSIPTSLSLAPPEIDRIFPTSDELPENILRFYIYFSNPMQRGWASRAIRLQREDGNEVENVFMEFKQELWSPDQKRLTVLLDPGRIKRGVATHDRFGQALVSGEQYKLVVDATWPDAQGQLLGTSFEKAFRVTPAVRSALKQKKWSLKVPSVGSLQALELTFDRPLDHALLMRMVGIRDAGGQDVPGSFEVSREETLLLFHPRQPWKSGDYEVVVQTILEDVAGNNLRGPLDRMVNEDIAGVDHVSLALRIGRISCVAEVRPF